MTCAGSWFEQNLRRFSTATPGKSRVCPGLIPGKSRVNPGLVAGKSRVSPGLVADFVVCVKNSSTVGFTPMSAKNQTQPRTP
jgi:hypothetical protein